MPHSLLLGNVHLALYYAHMEYGSLYPADECLTIWDVLDRWPRINLYELECLINKSDDGDPLLPPYEYERAVNMEPDDVLYLHRMRRGTLKISEINDFQKEVRDERGQVVASIYDTPSTSMEIPYGGISSISCSATLSALRRRTLITSAKFRSAKGRRPLRLRDIHHPTLPRHPVPQGKC